MVRGGKATSIENDEQSFDLLFTSVSKMSKKNRESRIKGRYSIIGWWRWLFST